MNDSAHARGLLNRRALARWLCVLVAVLEGFDLQVAGIAAPMLKTELDMSPADLGWFFSASTFGLLIGALVGGRLSDRFERGQVLALSVAMFGIATILTGLAPNATLLIAARALTGIGLGGALPALLAITSESASPGREKRAVALLYCGVPVGGGAVSLVGAAAGELWRIPFLVGGILPLLLAFPLWVALRDPASAPEATPNILRTSGQWALLDEGRAPLSMMLWLSFFATLIILYLVLNWLPTLLIGIGLDARTAFQAQLAFNAGGVALCALTAQALDGKRAWLIALLSFGTVPALLYAATGIRTAQEAVGVAFLLGAAVLVTQSYLYALAPTLYPTAGRATGVGAAVAAGRLGSIAGPLLGAALLASGSDTQSVLRSIIPVAFIAGTAAILLTFRARSRVIM